ncbi:MAG: di-heme oxidoredictase family protein [Pseudomonadota bacterium]
MGPKFPALAKAGGLAALGLVLAVVPSSADGERALTRHQSQAELNGRLSTEALSDLIAHGEHLFKARFTEADGVGRPFATQAVVPTKRTRPQEQTFQRLSGLDAGTCATCHRDPIIGGSGDFALNAFVVDGVVRPDFDTTNPELSNERNTNHLFGAGLVELLAREMTRDLQALRANALADARINNEAVSTALITKGVSFGRLTAEPDGFVDLTAVEGVDPDLIVRPFGQKGVVASLRQFTINALNQHHGMQADERFGPRWVGEVDFDGDGIEVEITRGDISALVAWQATRPPPTRELQQVNADRGAVEQGSRLFNDLGCATCHRRALPLDSTLFEDPASFDSAAALRAGDAAGAATYDLAGLDGIAKLGRDAQGRLMVPLFGDLKRHRMSDGTVIALANERLSQRFVDHDVFQTAELWGVGSTAPYGHRGDFPTLDGIIRAHGGDARSSRDAYAEQNQSARQAIIRFLKTLVIEP